MLYIHDLLSLELLAFLLWFYFLLKFWRPTGRPALIILKYIWSKFRNKIEIFEIYFSKFYFCKWHYFCIAESFILTKWGFDQVMNFYVVTGLFSIFPTRISNSELMIVSFCMGPTIMYFLKVVSSKPPKTSLQTY